MFSKWSQELLLYGSENIKTVSGEYIDGTTDETIQCSVNENVLNILRKMAKEKETKKFEVTIYEEMES